MQSTVTAYDEAMAVRIAQEMSGLATSFAIELTHVDVRANGGSVFAVRVDGACGPVHGLLSGDGFLSELAQRLELPLDTSITIDTPFECIVRPVPLTPPSAPPPPPALPGLGNESIAQANTANATTPLPVPLLVGLVVAGMLLVTTCSFIGYRRRRQQDMRRKVSMSSSLEGGGGRRATRGGGRRGISGMLSRSASSTSNSACSAHGSASQSCRLPVYILPRCDISATDADEAMREPRALQR